MHSVTRLIAFDRVTCDIFDTTLGKPVFSVVQHVISCAKPVREFLDLLSLLCHRLPLLPRTILLCHFPSHVLSKLSLVAGLNASIHITLPSHICHKQRSRSVATECNRFMCAKPALHLVSQPYVTPF